MRRDSRWLAVETAKRGSRRQSVTEKVRRTSGLLADNMLKLMVNQNTRDKTNFNSPLYQYYMKEEDSSYE